MTRKREPRKRYRPVAPKSLTGLIRVSKVGDRLDEGKSFLSPDDQLAAIKHYCDTHGIQLVAVFEEMDKSGGTTDREGLKEALDHVYACTDGLIVARVDRFARTLVQGLLAIYDLRDKGKAFVAPLDGIGSGGRADSLLLTFLLQMAEWQLDVITENWESVRRRHIASGIASIPPYGYKRGPDRRLVIVPPEAKWVRAVFRWRAEGVSYNGIADRLNARGVEPRNGGRWVHSTIGGMLANRTYLGELFSGIDYDGTAIINPDAHKPIVKSSLWDEANNASVAYERADAEAFPFASIVRCASCGGRMRGNSYVARPEVHHVKEETKHRYYRCRRKYSWGVCPDPSSVKADELEAYVRGHFEANYLVARLRSHEDAELVAARDALEEARSVLRRYQVAPSTVALERGDAEDQETAEAGKLERLAEVNAAKTELARLEREAGVGAIPANIAKLWPELDEVEQLGVVARAYGVIAVRGVGRDIRPIAERVRLWEVGDAHAPDGLPGRGSEANALRPIPFD